MYGTPFDNQTTDTVSPTPPPPVIAIPHPSLWGACARGALPEAPMPIGRSLQGCGFAVICAFLFSGSWGLSKGSMPRTNANASE